MRGQRLNLASRPFANNRPVVRLTVALWTAAILFLAADALLFGGYYRGRKDQRQQLAQVEAEIAAGRAAVGRLDHDLAADDVDQLNLRTELVNEKIAERTFAWGQLFDQLATILPNDVRLLSLTPQRPAASAAGRRRRGPAPPTAAADRVRLEIVGAARRDDAILELLDALFADPAFEDPNLASESRQQGEVRFSLSAAYLPATTAPPAAAIDAGGAAAGTAADGTAAGAPTAGDDGATQAPPGGRT